METSKSAARLEVRLGWTAFCHTALFIGRSRDRPYEVIMYLSYPTCNPTCLRPRCIVAVCMEYGDVCTKYVVYVRSRILHIHYTCNTPHRVFFDDLCGVVTKVEKLQALTDGWDVQSHSQD